MIIYDCIYGKIEFKRKIVRCMLTPEMQRLREVRLSNINSLNLTGAADINRFEHSVGTAYLAVVNERANKDSFSIDNADAFVLASLFHDMANGPFGHSYEYILEKQGFEPEKDFLDVFKIKTKDVRRKSARLEQFYLGEPCRIESVLKNYEIEHINRILKGEDEVCSKILSDVIDLDNIDNVYRMAYHMGLPINKSFPVELAKSLMCRDGKVVFKESAIPYLYDWYALRSKEYEILLYNPEDFAAKCMLNEALELTLENEPGLIKWNYTDRELIGAMLKGDDVWDTTYVIIKENITVPEDIGNDKDRMIELLISCGVNVPSNANIDICRSDEGYKATFYNTTYLFTGDKLLKEKVVSLSTNRIVKRLMCGDLYRCIGLYVCENTDSSEVFFDRSKRVPLQFQCMDYLSGENDKESIMVSFHAIIDKKKTNRRLEITTDSGNVLEIGKDSNDLIIGAFISNPRYGMAKSELNRKRMSGLRERTGKFLADKGFYCVEYNFLNHAYGGIK